MSKLIFHTECKSILECGSKSLGLEMGIVSRIIDQKYEIRELISTLGVFVVGKIFDLKDTYCRDVVKNNRTVALTQVENVPGLQKHPLYVPSSLEAYIGTPLYSGNNVWGTINFSSMKIRPEEFSDLEIQQVEKMAKNISFLISNNL